MCASQSFHTLTAGMSLPLRKAKCPLISAGILFITGGLGVTAPPTCSGQDTSFFGGDVDSNFSPDCWLTPHDICYV